MVPLTTSNTSSLSTGANAPSLFDAWKDARLDGWQGEEGREGKRESGPHELRQSLTGNRELRFRTAHNRCMLQGQCSDHEAIVRQGVSTHLVAGRGRLRYIRVKRVPFR